MNGITGSERSTVRVKGLRFIPSSINFSQLSPGQENKIYDEMQDEDEDINIDKEILLLKSLSKLNSDKERCVLLLEILREYGYQLDYKSIALSLNVQLRWFMRIKKAVHDKVHTITDN
jgi:hypothetical protein